MTKLNPKDAPPGYVAVLQGPGDTCQGCAFNRHSWCSNPDANCINRDDERCVIFKKVKKSPRPVSKPLVFVKYTCVDKDGVPRGLHSRSMARSFRKMHPGWRVVRVKVTEMP